MPKDLNTALCAFCGGKELAFITVTGRTFPMGEKCFDKALQRGVTWDEDTSLTELRRRLRKRTLK